MKNFVAWVEIPTTNFERAVKFYNSVFKFELKVADCGDEKMAFFPNEDGAVISAPGYKPSPDGVMVSFNVADDIDSTLERIKSEGGGVITPKTKIQAEGRAYFAVFTDSEGNKVGLYGN
jgi:predicted enzyme related to lactoylglutathione lyase